MTLTTIENRLRQEWSHLPEDVLAEVIAFNLAAFEKENA